MVCCCDYFAGPTLQTPYLPLLSPTSIKIFLSKISRALSYDANMINFLNHFYWQVIDTDVDSGKKNLRKH